METVEKSLLGIAVDDLERVLEARRTIREVEQKLVTTHATNGNVDASKDHNGSQPNHSGMSPDVRRRISRTMKRRWEEKREKKGTEKVAA